MKTLIKERPILFSGMMVRAILEGRKTQTRRVIKPQPQTFGGVPIFISDSVEQNQFMTEITGHAKPKCPYGQHGDRLWVREKWWHEKGLDFENAAFEDGTLISNHGAINQIPNGWHPTSPIWFPRPSIHMPRWASRIDLEVVRVRVERLQDISEEDALAEGIIKNEYGYLWEGMKRFDAKDVFASPKYAFANLINWVNGGENWNFPDKPKPIWDLNPWVWVIEFGRIVKL